ncbi:MAG: phosphatase PAP2 family protein, partial [Candidatus Eisenbacteria sp.]|nr:phosphatase PAP2 family protein [Candidatus Eisenbacteria bacterium]
VYLILASALLIFSPLPVSDRTPLTGVYLLLLVAVSCLRFVPREGYPWLRWTRDWYPMFLIPLFYNYAQHLNRLVTTGYLDSRVVALEQAIFGLQPSEELWRMVPAVAVSELLHFSYVAYAPTILGVTLFLYLARSRREFRLYITSVMTTFIFCSCVFILLPVKGPFQFFGPLGPEVKHAFFARVAHWMLRGGSSVGTAFPSSHVAAIVCVWLVSRRSLGWLAWIVLAIAIGIFVGAVYGGFHYAVDTIAGLAVGLVMGLLGPKIHTAITRLLDGSRRTNFVSPPASP